MSKQIKITESQLKELIKHNETSNKTTLNEFFFNPAVKVAKTIAPTIVPIILDALREELANQNSTSIEEMDVDNKKDLISSLGEYIKYEMMIELGLHESDNEENDDQGQENSDEEGIQADNELNEAKKSLKNTFNRFL